MARKRIGLGVVGVFVLVAGMVRMSLPASAHDRVPTVRHVLLLSVDGMHQSDLDWYVAHHPRSALASLVAHGDEYTRARTPVPSDSFPGMVGQVTGGNPSSTGVYYDDTFNHALLPAGTTPAQCATAKPGVEVTYFEQLDKNQHALDAGQGLAGLPGSILQMTANPNQVIDPTQLPVDPSSCQPVYPHQYLKVNTVFEVARTAGLRTAWSDKHPAYEILNGPSGTGVQDLFTPEINSDAPTLGSSGDWTSVNTLTQQYDSYKVRAVLNEINGFDHTGTKKVGTPAIFGMNFQTVSTAQKLPLSVTATSGTTQLPGGYEADGVTPGPVLRGALDYIDARIGSMLDAIWHAGLADDTVVILSAKHGQSPQKPSELTRIDDGKILDALDAAWAAQYPSAVQPLVAFSVDDDGMLIWLNDRSPVATHFAAQFLLGFNGTGNGITGAPKAFTSSGLTQVFAGEQAADYFHVQPGDPRVPDVFGISQVGVVYTGKQGKIAEHGGANPADRDVPLLVSGTDIAHDRIGAPVETTQIAPTILKLLGLDPHFLQAVQIEHTQVLPH
jgi:hypothetical protein